MTGYGSNDIGSTYVIVTSLYSAAGARTWHEEETPTDGLAYGSDVVIDGQERVLVTGAVMQGGKLRGYMFARRVQQPGLVLFDHWFPGVGPSEGLGIAADIYDRIFAVGYITANGQAQAVIMLLHG